MKDVEHKTFPSPNSLPNGEGFNSLLPVGEGLGMRGRLLLSPGMECMPQQRQERLRPAMSLSL